MKLTLEPTSKMVELETQDGAVMSSRLWQGHDEHGVAVHAFITCVAVHKAYPAEVHARFAQQLQERVEPRAELRVIPLRLII